MAGLRDSLWYLPPHALKEAARAAVIPALDSTAGIFNNLVSTFPLAAVAALLLLVNWGGHQGVLWRALRRRCGRWALRGARGDPARGARRAGEAVSRMRCRVSWMPSSGCNGRRSPRGSAFLFEYMFGVGVQLYLLLLAYCWVRGLTFRPGHLLDFAIRRFSFVLRWAAVVMVLSTLFIDLPLMLQNAPFFSRWFAATAEAIDARTNLARVALDLIFLTWCSVQITLMLHNESLRQSLQRSSALRGAQSLAAGVVCGHRGAALLPAAPRASALLAGVWRRDGALGRGGAALPVARRRGRRVAPGELGLGVQAQRRRPPGRCRVGALLRGCVHLCA